MPVNNDRSHFIVGLFVLAFIVFNFPFLGIFGKGQSLGGLPLLFWFFFATWVLVIVGIAVVNYISKRKF